MKRLLLSILLLCSIDTFSQTPVAMVPHYENNMVRNIQREITFFGPSNNNVRNKYSSISTGSPYFNEGAWMKAIVFVTDSTADKNIWVRLDLMETAFEFRNQKGEFVSSSPVYAIDLTDSISGVKFKFIPSSRIPGAPSKTWYQVLSSGAKTTLIKEYYKEIIQPQEYAAMSGGQEVRTVERYYLWSQNKLTRVKKNSDILEFSGEKRTLLQNYIDKNNLNAKNEPDLINLMAYYHTLN